MKKGFSLIEVLMSVSISAVLAYSIFLIFGQVQRSVKLVERFVANDSSVLIFQNQFERDITGAFDPQYWIANSKEKAAKDKSKWGKLENVFVYKKNEDNLKELSFITCNPLQVYNNSKPRISRVMYRLLQNQDTFNLIRQESQELDYTKFDTEKVVAYPILSNIENFELEFIYSQQENEKDKNSPREFKVTKEWPPTETQDKSEANTTSTTPKIPEYVILKFSVSDPLSKAQNSYEVRYKIFAGQPVRSTQSNNPTQSSNKPDAATNMQATNPPAASGIAGINPNMFGGIPGIPSAGGIGGIR